MERRSTSRLRLFRQSSVTSELSEKTAEDVSQRSIRRAPRERVTKENFPLSMGWHAKIGFATTFLEGWKYWSLGFRYYLDNLNKLKNEVLSGLTVAIAQVPESVAFSFVANVNPIVGLHSTFWMGLVTSLFNGRQGAVSGTAGAMAVVAQQVTEQNGIISQDFLLERGEISAQGEGPTLRKQAENRRLEYLFATTVMTGVIQLILTIIPVGYLIKMVPESVKVGFANGLAIIIARAQIDVFKVPDWQASFNEMDLNGDGVLTKEDVRTFLEKNTKLGGDEEITPEVERIFRETDLNGNGKITRSEFTSDDEFAIHDFHSNFERWRKASNGTTWLMLFYIALTMPIVHWAKKFSNFIPSSLIAIILCTILEQLAFRKGADISTPTVGDLATIGGDPPSFHVPDIVLDGEAFSTLLPTALTLAGVGFVESWLTIQLVMEIAEDPSGIAPRAIQESFAQGLGNLVAGFSRGFGGDAMIGQSTINMHGGGDGRLSTTVAAMFFLVIIVAASTAIEWVPMGCLTGILFMVVIYTFRWDSLEMMTGNLWEAVRKRKQPPNRMPWQDAVVIAFVTAVTVASNLALAVALGVALACVIFSWQQGSLIKVKVREKGLLKWYKVHGNFFFANTENVKAKFYAESDPDHIVLDMRTCNINDFSALTTLEVIGQRYAAKEKSVAVIVHEDNLPLIRLFGTWLRSVDITTDESAVEDLAAGSIEGDAGKEPTSHFSQAKSPTDSAHSLPKEGITRSADEVALGGENTGVGVRSSGADYASGEEGDYDADNGVSGSSQRI